MRKISVFLAFVCLLAVTAGTASAAGMDSAGNKFDFAPDVISDTRVEGDYMALGANVKLESGVGGDIFAFGRNIVITDDAAVQNIIAAGQNVSIRAKSARNIYAGGGDLTVNAGTEAKGVYLIGATVTFGGIATDASIAATSVSIDGTIYNDLIIRSDGITFGKNVSVGGHITIFGSVKPQLPPTIKESQVTFKRIMHKDTNKAPRAERGISRMAVIMTCVAVVTAVFIALLLTLFRGSFFRHRAEEFRHLAGRQLLCGLIGFIVVPIAALICMLTIFAIPVCVIVLMVYGILLYLAPVITGIILGRLVLPRLNRYLAASIGAGVITLLMAVPYLKVLLFLLSAFYVLGILIRRMKPRREGNHPEVSERPYND